MMFMKNKFILWFGSALLRLIVPIKDKKKCHKISCCEIAWHRVATNTTTLALEKVIAQRSIFFCNKQAITTWTVNVV